MSGEFETDPAEHVNFASSSAFPPEQYSWWTARSRTSPLWLFPKQDSVSLVQGLLFCLKLGLG